MTVLTVLTIFSCGYSRPDDVAALGEAAPEVIQAEPAPNSAGVEPDAAIRVRFSKPVDPVSAAVTVEAAGLPVDGTIEVVNGDTVEFRPSAALAKGMPYAVTVTRIADLANNARSTPYTYDFTTVTAACVRPGGAGGCFALPSTAVAAATAGDSIAVAAGMYMDNVVIDRTVNLLGGYDDTLSLRDAKTYVTTIRALSSEFSIVRIDTRSGDVLNTAVVDGFTITGNKLRDHGAGLASLESNPRIRNNVISANTGYFLGGGVYIRGGFAHLAKNRIEDNVLDSGSGAGIATENSAVEMFDNLIVNNRISAPAGNGYGGGVSITGGTVIMRDNRIEGNHLDGAEILYGGGVSIARSTVVITGGTISRNEFDFSSFRTTADSGAGVYMERMSVVHIEGVAIRDNTGSAASTAGASGIHAEASTLVVASSIIAGNRSGTAGISLGATGTYVIVNCTIADNTARGVRAQSRVAMVNSIVAQEPVGVEIVGPQADAVYNNVFFGVTTTVVGAVLDASNRTLDPRLDAELHLAADSPLIDAGRSGPVRLSEIAFAPPSIDIDGQLRAVPGRAGNAALPDIGADEYHP